MQWGPSQVSAPAQNAPASGAPDEENSGEAQERRREPGRVEPTSAGSLPASIAPGSGTPAPSGITASGAQRNSRIIVAEDDFEISTLISLTLRMEGYEVLQARDGHAALQMTRAQRPDLILLDVMMPHLSGYDVAKVLQEEPGTSSIPIIFVTAKHEMEDRVLGLGLAIDYICKPFAVPELLARVRAALRVRHLQEELRLSNERWSRLAVTDELTGLANRRGFDGDLEEELLRSRRFTQPLTVVAFDLDHFKRINDTWGHARGDVVLQSFARTLQHLSRRVDKVARIGGEEFVALLPTTDAEGARIFAEKVRAATEALEIPADGEASPLRVTVSVGLAVLDVVALSLLPQPGAEAGVQPGVWDAPAAEAELDEAANADIARDLLKIADDCLYEAKDSGRNRVVMRVIQNWDELPSRGHS
jgi:diguanylate cyclase (GGDEF)-like protein